VSVATAAVSTGTHYLDFGGNPTVVAAQQHLTRSRSGLALCPRNPPVRFDTSLHSAPQGSSTNTPSRVRSSSTADTRPLSL
jgi:hypothetical protein